MIEHYLFFCLGRGLANTIFCIVYLVKTVKLKLSKLGWSSYVAVDQHVSGDLDHAGELLFGNFNIYPGQVKVGLVIVCLFVLMIF